MDNFTPFSFISLKYHTTITTCRLRYPFLRFNYLWMNTTTKQRQVLHIGRKRVEMIIWCLLPFTFFLNRTLVNVYWPSIYFYTNKLTININIWKGVSFVSTAQGMFFVLVSFLFGLYKKRGYRFFLYLSRKIDCFFIKKFFYRTGWWYVCYIKGWINLGFFLGFFFVNCNKWK